MSPQNALLCFTYFFFQRSLAKRYVFHCFSAGLPEMTHISNEFYQFLLETDFFNFWPLRSLHDSYGLAHMPILTCQKWYIFPMNFNNFTFCYLVRFKIIAPTNGFGHFFVLHRFHCESLRPIAITRCYVLSFFVWNPHLFAMFSCTRC